MPSHKTGGKTTSGGATGINKTGSVAGKHTSPKKGKPYTAKSDKTLTASQAKLGGFRPEVVKQVSSGKSIGKGSFRSPSNPTKRGFKSGYHEAYVVTDATKLLSQRKKSGKGFAELPKSSGGSWKKHSGAKIREQNVRPALEAGDGARTDTSRTILSAPGGKVAGHTGSGVKTTGQAEAHNLLRDQSVRALADPKLSPEAQGVVAGLTTLWSIAPGTGRFQAQGQARQQDLGGRPQRRKEAPVGQFRQVAQGRTEGGPQARRGLPQEPQGQEAQALHGSPRLAAAGNRAVQEKQPDPRRRLLQKAAVQQAAEGGAAD